MIRLRFYFRLDLGGCILVDGGLEVDAFVAVLAGISFSGDCRSVTDMGCS